MFILIIGVFPLEKERGTRNNRVFVQGNVKFCGCRVIVYAGIFNYRHTDLRIIRNRALTGQRYRDAILRPVQCYFFIIVITVFVHLLLLFSIYYYLSCFEPGSYVGNLTFF